VYRELELELMTGYYRHIKYARSGAKERARYNVPAGNAYSANMHKQPDGNTLVKKLQKGTADIFPKTLSPSDVIIGSMGQRRMCF
jgi:hypothetical protein